MITYNGEDFLYDQIESILNQLSIDDELIISDDSSTDNTLTIIRSFNDSRIKLYENRLFRNPTFNMEFALMQANGDIIFMCDQDDVWLDNKVMKMIEYLHVYDYVVHDCYITDSKLNILHDTRFTKDSNIKKNKYLALFYSTPYQGSCVAFKREILNKALPFPRFIQSHDRWIGNVASFFYKPKLISDKLILYRRHGQNASSSTTGKSPNRFLKRIYFRFGYVYGLLMIKFKLKR